MKPIRAIYENGVFRPTEPVSLPEHTEVEVQPREQTEDGLIGVRLPDAPLPESAKNHPQYEVLKILSRRYRSGRHDLAERHNEHQP
jgi:predicted DNA-binding antitoxin AbrB/MazE fold protein